MTPLVTVTSADFVPFVCFLGTPPPMHPLRTSYMEAPLSYWLGESQSAKTIFALRRSPREGETIATIASSAERGIM